MSSPEQAPERPPASRLFYLSEDLKDKKIDQVVTLGVAGNGGSFSEQAARQFQKDRAIAVIKVVYLITAEAVMRALDRGEIDYSVVATHNNHGGLAIENQEALATHRWSPETNIVLPVCHMLMTRPEAGRILTIVTQPQAHEQCKETVKKMQGVKVISYPDTATAAKDLADGTLAEKIPGLDLATTAVIGPEGCAALNGLVIRMRDVQDNKDNKTTFAIGKRYSGPSPT